MADISKDDLRKEVTGSFLIPLGPQVSPVTMLFFTDSHSSPKTSMIDTLGRCRVGEDDGLKELTNLFYGPSTTKRTRLSDSQLRNNVILFVYNSLRKHNRMSELSDQLVGRR
uniref:Uncharacterized protein n=1 Tax=Timema monikensis TaxID=170555 RepID=A0A7R9EHV6_9NEOP|nr:unnamed protein product [Timema monikensis]